jgi:hypothetical protein
MMFFTFLDFLPGDEHYHAILNPRIWIKNILETLDLDPYCTQLKYGSATMHFGTPHLPLKVVFHFSF